MKASTSFNQFNKPVHSKNNSIASVKNSQQSVNSPSLVVKHHQSVGNSKAAKSQLNYPGHTDKSPSQNNDSEAILRVN
jgi:hypothetical protein